MILVYRQFEGANPPGDAKLARLVRPGKPNICCFAVESTAEWLKEGWFLTVEEAEAPPKKARRKAAEKKPEGRTVECTPAVMESEGVEPGVDSP